MYLKRLITVLAGNVIACFFYYAMASGLQISPVRINLSKEQTINSFTITNSTPKKVLLQSEIKRWRQEGTRNVYTPSQDLIIAPPIASIEPGQSQIFRVALRQFIPSKEEASYRLYLQEVVPNLNNSPGLHFALRIGLPIFVAPHNPSPKKITWEVKKTKEALLLKAHNFGNTHVQVSHLLLVDSEGEKPLIDKTVFRYLLAGKSYTWTFNTQKKAKQFMDSIKLSKLEAKTDIGTLNSDVTIS